MAKLGNFVASQVLTAAELNAGAGAWANWPSSPTYTGLTIGNGTVVAKYAFFGRTVFLYWAFTLGTTSAVTGAVSVGTIPVNAANVRQLDGPFATLNGPPGHTAGASASVISIRASNVAGTYPTQVDLSSTIPITWTTGATMSFNLFYEGVS